MTGTEKPSTLESDLPAGVTVIRARGIHKSFGSFTALGGVDLDVHRGEVLCIIGPSGSGKSATSDQGVQ